mmetsp:Transcript_15778/g.22439  ORF Transcript_15778/g.22439 Transcript_15778/m.22439 type:complete len:258 (+) Transcript_15778:37-810(+)
MGKKSGGRVRVKQLGPKGGGAPINPLADLAIPPEEMINLPPKPDPNITHIWPLAETFTMQYKRFNVIWPSNLDSTKSVKLGRCISTADAVPDPAVTEISEALQTLNIRHAVQPYKGYPRDTESRWYNAGRVMVDMEQAAQRINGRGGGRVDRNTVGEMGPDGSFDLNSIPNIDNDGEDKEDGENTSQDGKMNKRILMKEIAKLVPTMPSRIRRMEEKKKAEEEEKRKKRDEARAKAAAKISGAGGGGSNKKKGKKRR